MTKTVALKDVALLIRGVSYPKNKSSVTARDGYSPIFRANNIQESLTELDLIFVSDTEIDPKQYVRKGDIVIAMSSGSKQLVGKTAQAQEDKDIAFGAFCGVIRPRDNIDSKYLGYYFQTQEYRNFVSASSKGIGINNLRRGHIEELQIPIFQIDDQKKIVLKLDELVSELDFAKNNLTEQLKQLENYRRSLLNSAFKTAAPPVRLKDVTHKIQDGSHFSPKNQYDEPGQDRYMYITSKNIRNDVLELDNVKYVDSSFHDDIYRRCDVKLGDVLLTKDGVNTGNITLNTLEEPFSLLSSVCLIRADQSKILPSYIKLYIQSPNGLHNLTGKMTGTAIKRIVLRQIKELLIPLPTLDEQKRIVDEVEGHLSEVDEIRKSIIQGISQANLLRKAALSKAFKGELI